MGRRPHLPDDDASRDIYEGTERLDRLERRTAKRAAEADAPTPGPQYASTKWSFGHVATSPDQAYWARYFEDPTGEWPGFQAMTGTNSFLDHKIAVGMAPIEPHNTGGGVEAGYFQVPVDGLYEIESNFTLSTDSGTNLSYLGPEAKIEMHNLGVFAMSDDVEVAGPDRSGFVPTSMGETATPYMPVAEDVQIWMTCNNREKVWCPAGTVCRPLAIYTFFHDCAYPAGGGIYLIGSACVTFLAPWRRTRA